MLPRENIYILAGAFWIVLHSIFTFIRASKQGMHEWERHYYLLAAWQVELASSHTCTTSLQGCSAYCGNTNQKHLSTNRYIHHKYNL